MAQGKEGCMHMSHMSPGNTQGSVSAALLQAERLLPRLQLWSEGFLWRGALGHVTSLVRQRALRSSSEQLRRQRGFAIVARQVAAFGLELRC